jgi:subtilisin family serine protease
MIGKQIASHAHTSHSIRSKRKVEMSIQTKIKRLIMIGTSLMLLFLLSGYPGTVRADDDDDNAGHVPGQVIIRLQPGASIDTINLTYNTVTLAELAPGRGVYLLQAREGDDDDDDGLEDLLERMANDPRLVYAELNLIAESPEAIRSKDWNWGGQDEQPFREQYALLSINLTGAHSYSTGANTIIAIVDTGVQLDHFEFAGRITTMQADFIDGDGIAYDEPNGLDDDGDGQIDEATGHGTHVAGIAHLVAPDAQIMPVRALDSDGMGDAFLVAEAILFAVENGARVINLSLGTSAKSDLLEDAIEEATESGVLVIAAAGNWGTSQQVYPAAEECALAITSVGPTDVKSGFANYGRWVDLAAPGESIYSSFPVNGYAWWSGTSMAAPFVAGQAALLLSYDPSLDIVSTANLLGDTVESLALTNPRLVSRNLLGAGKINISASLSALATGEIRTTPGLLDDGCQ